MRNFTTAKTKLLCLLLAIVLTAMTACGPQQNDPITGSQAGTGTTEPSFENSLEEHTAIPEEEQARFSAYTRELFLEAVLDNTINLHYTLAEPESFGITEYPISFGTYEIWDEEMILADLDEMYTELRTYHYDLLTEEQQLTYDILMHDIETEYAASSLYLYSEPLGIFTGAATQIPITLAEYKFYREQDIKDYLELLPQLQSYFEYLISFEQLRADAGLFMAEFTLDANLDSCESFLENPENNYLILSFASRLETIDWLDEQAKADYIDQHRTIVFDSVFPAFEYLAEALEGMRQYCTIDGGLAELPKGADFFTYLMNSRLGSDRTVEEMLTLITEYQQKQLMAMSTLITKDQSLLTAFTDMSFTYTDPSQALDYLKERISADYPEIPETSYTIKYVEEELEDVLSPAFYMIPPLDRYQENTIYINNGSVDPTTLFTTLAHEGYPGHLYQNVYFHSNNSEPLRSMFSYLGYSEGWATYVEGESYLYDPNLSADLAQLASLNNSITLSVYAALDIYINYMGWDLAQATEYIVQFFGEQPGDVCSEIYQMIAGDPCYYLAYHCGYLEILEMRAVAETTLGDKFDLKEFHRFVLDLGECPFAVANDRLADWLEEQG